MGCCTSCYNYFCRETTRSQNRDINEHTHLLVDPVTNNTTIQRVHHHLSGEPPLRHHPNLRNTQKKSDEQTALDRILQETSTNVIDVAALDSHNLQQHEYLERMRHYNYRVQQVFAGNRRFLTEQWKSFLLEDVQIVEKILNSPTSSQDVLDMMSSIMNEAVKAVNDIQIEHKEDVVIPLMIKC